jgi:pimeloyl-ACP methyl ester carboxylesterase
VDTAVDTYGYSTLALDRFGISQSTHGDPISEVQAPAELAALVAVTLKLKAGGISCIPAPQKVVHVGHSFGSLLTFALISFFPTVSDGAILTGFSGATQFLPITLAGWDFVSAAANQPLRFGSASPSILNKIVNLKASVAELVKFDLLDLVAAPAKGEKQTPLPSGYLTWGNLGANQFTFLTPPFYDPAFATVLEQTKQPVTMGELLTIGAAPPFGAQEFAGPVLVLTGQFDQIFCGGDCLATGNASIPNIPGEVAPAFPKAKPFQTYIQPNSGHAVNVHFNSTGAYKVINEFLGKNL